MNWVKIANSFPTNPKVMRAGPEAGYLFVCGLCYSNEHLLDGAIPRDLLAGVAPSLARPERHAKRLCDVGLWEPADDGWVIHDYLDFQRSSDAIREVRALDSERKRRDRSGRSPNGVPAESGASRARAPSREERREEKKDPPVVPPKGGRQRERQRWEKDVAAYAALHFPGLDLGESTRAVRQAVMYGKAQSLQDVVAFIRDQFPQLHTQLRRVEGGTA